MSQRAGSITPETVRKSTPKPITVFQGGDESIDNEAMRIEKFKDVFGPDRDRAAVVDPNTVKRLGRLDAYQELLEGREFVTKGKNSTDRTYSYRKFLEEFEGIDLYVEEEFASSTSQVSRIGLDLSLKGLDDAQRQEIYDKLTQIKIETTDAISVALSATTGASSGRAKDYPHILHPLEVYRIRDAIKFALDTEQRCVVTDIFAREDNGDFKFEDDNGVKVPEIHTILLCFQKGLDYKDQILVMDPNNSDYSKHLIYNKDIILGAEMDAKICAPKKSVQIYTPPTKESDLKTGPLLQHRDCTDIAVKLGLAMMEYDELLLGRVNVDSLKEIRAIKCISNNSKFDNSVFYDGKTKCVRICQATEADIRFQVQQLIEDSYCLVQRVGKELKEMKLATKIQRDLVSAFCVSHNEPDSYADDLSRLHMLYNETLQLVGEVGLEL